VGWAVRLAAGKEARAAQMQACAGSDTSPVHTAMRACGNVTCRYDLFGSFKWLCAQVAQRWLDFTQEG
jgi:hypothetical protein